jgi:hypothetical protein
MRSLKVHICSFFVVLLSFFLSLQGAQYPDLAADPIIVHPDVRRMLLTQKCLAEGARAMCYEVALR